METGTRAGFEIETEINVETGTGIGMEIGTGTGMETSTDMEMGTGTGMETGTGLDQGMGPGIGKNMDLGIYMGSGMGFGREQNADTLFKARVLSGEISLMCKHVQATVARKNFLRRQQEETLRGSSLRREPILNERVDD